MRAQRHVRTYLDADRRHKPNQLRGQAEAAPTLHDMIFFVPWGGSACAKGGTGAVRTGLAGEALPRDAELVALGVLHDRPSMAAQTVIANDCRSERDQLVDS